VSTHLQKKDLELQKTIENILKGKYPGQGLMEYFDGLPDKRARRAISILAGIYPDKTTSSDGEFSFVLFMFSNMKFMEQKNFWLFVQTINILQFTEPQKKLLKDAVTNNIETLCRQCTFELDSLLVNVFEANDLLHYLDYLSEKKSRAVLVHVFDTLRHAPFANNDALDEHVGKLREKVSPLVI